MNRKYEYSTLIKKKLKKLKGKELANVMNKIEEVLSISDINHYKNLKNELKRFKRVHVNKSYIILFLGDDNRVYFVDYDHHDKIYTKKYDSIKF